MFKLQKNICMLDLPEYKKVEYINIDKGNLVKVLLCLLHLYIFINVCEIVKWVTHCGTKGV